MSATKNNHPNRGRNRAVPTPSDVLLRREHNGLTQGAAAKLIHCSVRTWQFYESGERRMHAAFWELFCIKTE